MSCIKCFRESGQQIVPSDANDSESTMDHDSGKAIETHPQWNPALPYCTNNCIYMSNK